MSAKRRVPPPPPPGFGDDEYYRLYGRPEDYHKYREELERKMRLQKGGDRPGSPLESGEEIDDDTEEEKFENFRVTIDNDDRDSEGTPSLSEEEEFQPPRRSVKERLGKRPMTMEKSRKAPPRVSSPIIVHSSSSSSSSFEDSASESGTESSSSEEDRRLKRDRKRKSTSPRSRLKSPRRSRSNSRGRNLSSRSNDARRNSDGRRNRIKSPVRDESNRSRNGQNSSAKKKKKRKKKGSGRNNGIPLNQRMADTNKENEAMMRRLARKRRGRQNSESNKVQSLARLAGIEIPVQDPPPQQSRRSRGSREGKSFMRSDVLEEESRKRGRQRRQSPERKKSSDKWKHDKFTEASPTKSVSSRDEEDEFRSHWRSNNSKRLKSKSRSSSRDGGRRRRRYSSSSSRSLSHSSSYSSSSSRSSTSLRQDLRENRLQRKKEKPPPSPPPPVEPEGVNMATSGKLLEDTNVVNGVVVKYSEPDNARKPRTKWRLYVFKGEEELPILYIHRQSSYLLGRDRKVADVPLDHPSCSKQHAALQYRLITLEGGRRRKVLPCVIDLGSANGTFLNNRKIESQRFVELREKDVLKFGFSSREYVLLHDQSKDADEDDPGVE